MSSPTVLSNFLSSLPPRPPTPPREAHHDATAALHPSLGAVDSRLSLHTPPGFQSPASSIATGSTARRIRKKVGFSALAEYKDPPVYPDGAGVAQHPTPVSLPRSETKPVKSILKATNHVSNLLEPAAGEDTDPSKPHPSLAAMLESTLQQLAGGDRDSKIDAYLMLTRAWKASNNLPDRVALQEKMGLFTQFMQRDIVTRTPEGSLDTSLVNHALNLLNTFLHFPAIASTIPNEFGVFVIDHCIRSFEDALTPKDTARRLMQVISLQNFSPKVMTSDRVARLVSSLHNIEEHLKGKSIVLSRVLIYRKLVQQSRQLMVVHSDWLLDMFTDMLSNLRDIRSAAISLGLEAGFSIGHEKQLSRKVMEVLNLSYEDRRYIQYYEERLTLMAKDKHESAVVPDIWSVVILLLRVRLDKWEFAGPWLVIIQSCFNSVDFPTKIAANRAWARLVYLMHLEERALSKNLKTLTTPLISQLRRKGSGKTSEELRQAVVGGICNLFYYAFKPSTDPTLLDTYWSASVKPVLSKLLDPAAESAGDNLHQACAILTGLFDSQTPRRWREDHIVGTALVKPEELPAIDPKWIRSNTSRVFAVVEPILDQDFLAFARTDSATFGLWQRLVSTVASAAAKEIKVSRDTALFAAESINVLQKLWKRGVPSQEASEANVLEFLLAVRAYLEVMITSLGLLPFTEKAGKHQAPAKAPLYTLFTMLSTLPPGVSDDKDFAEFFGSVFAPFFASKAEKAKMDLAQDLLSGIPMDTPRPYGAWLLASENILSWLEPRHHSHRSSGSAGETPVGHDYRDIVRVLERGIRSTPNLPAEHWQSLFYATVEQVREETGDAGVAIVVIEPLAKILLDHCANHKTDEDLLSRVQYVTELVSVATQPRDRQAVDAARKRLWGTVLAGSRSSSFDTFDSLYKTVNEVLEHLYRDFNSTSSAPIAQLLKELGDFFDRCNRQLFLRALTALQDGILLWVQDSKRLLGSPTGAVLGSTKSLWDKLSHLIAVVEHPEQHLQCLERLFLASFASCHRSIVNSGISLWNRLFENIEHMEYPEELKAALVQLQLHADIVLPGLETSSVEYAGQQPSFVDSFDDFSLPRYPSTRSSSRRETPRPNSSQSRPSQSPASLKPATRHAGADPQRTTAAVGRQNKPRRPKHEDSQVQFAAIEPSSVPGSPVESQVLTERQQEVRERQQQNAALFPEIRSSPGIKQKDAGRQVLPTGPRTRQAATPEPERAFDDYVSSTPTPRRGPALVMPEHDMTDPPSSPPEMRGNPLAAEIRSRSASHSLFEDWQFSSSPVSGSPNPTRHGVVPNPSSQRGYVSVVSLPEVEDAPQLPSSPTGGDEEPEPESPADDIIEDSMVFEPAEVAPVPKSIKASAEEGPSTPRHSAQLSQFQARETPTPKSDGDVFVDAPTSPLPPSPGRSKKAARVTGAVDITELPVVPAANTSFDLSDVDETSFLRLVVELDSGKVDPSEYHRSSPSVSSDGKGQRSPPVADCIVVGDSPKKAEAAAVPARRSRATSASSSSAEPGDFPSSQAKLRPGRQKRKRATSKAHANSPKRQRHEPVEGEGQAPDSHAVASQNADIEVHGSEEAPGPVSNSVREDHISPDERIPSSSAEDSSSESVSVPADSQDSAKSLPKPADVMELEQDDQDVQSQIALEFSHSQRQEEDGMPAFEADSPQQEMPTIEEQPPVADGEEMPDVVVAEAAEPQSIVVADQASPPEPDPVQKIMGFFRSGLDELRSARLSRGEVYRIEDMFMDMKRELYEAERRGRA